nr:immunoglobulin heavy chain junction region [Macaca mulatta]MOV40465.1 immunoglobulin heavy chain junction region [Macaca mulatta]
CARVYCGRGVCYFHLSFDYW